ncbi:TPR repeat-containing protein NMB0313 precursor [Edwardsiella tarda]|nr:TPR repeat-containing protein NMB0313 precursor [Edwardsiella tarda]
MKLSVKLLKFFCFPLMLLVMPAQAMAQKSSEQKPGEPIPIIALSTKDLERYPYIVYQGLLQSLIQQNTQSIEIFLPVYQKLSNADPAFIRWANAIQAWHGGKYREAIRQYRLLIADYPDNEIIRLQLAMALFDNQDNESAERQFQKLRSGKLTPELEQVLDSYLLRIQQRDFWSFNVQLSYANESNINNAPPVGTVLNGWKPARPESATGFDYGLSTQKSWSLKHGMFMEYRVDGYGNQYWDNHKYDQLIIRNSVGLGYRDKDTRFLVLPFYEQRWYGGGSGGEGGLRNYANSYGLRGESRFQLTGNWLLYIAGEYGINNYYIKNT